MVTSEILMASEMPSCPLEMSNIPIAKCDEMYDKDCKGDKAMPFYRAQYDRSTGQSPNMPREQVSGVVVELAIVVIITIGVCAFRKTR